MVGVGGAGGASTVTVAKTGGVPSLDVLPARSVWMALSECGPSARGVASSHDQLPPASPTAGVVHAAGAPST